MMTSRTVNLEAPLVLPAVFLACVVFMLGWQVHFPSQWLWDYDVYERAAAHMARTGTPYEIHDGLMYQYPPSGNLFLSLFNFGLANRSLYLALCFACVFSIPFLVTRASGLILACYLALPLLFEGIAIGTVKTGNVAPILQFSALLASLLYYSGRIGPLSFGAILLPVIFIKPFYLAFTLFVLGREGVWVFLKISLLLFITLLVVNYGLFADQTSQFLGIIAEDMRRGNLGWSAQGLLRESGASFASYVIVSMLLFAPFITCVALRRFESNERNFALLAILSLMIYPRPLTYDLAAAIVPLLIVILTFSNNWVRIPLCALLLLASTYNVGLHANIIFQWWLFIYLVLLVAFADRCLRELRPIRPIRPE